MKKVLVVGSGPSGSYASSLLSEKFDVNIFEEHKVEGLPIQCTGLVSESIKSFVNIKSSFLENSFSNVNVKVYDFYNNVFLNEDSFFLNGKEFLLKRDKFDSFLLKKAEDNNVNVFFSRRVLDVIEKDSFVKVKFKDTIKNEVFFKTFDYVFGADGSNSIVNRSLNIIKNRKYYFASQIVFDDKNNVFRSMNKNNNSYTSILGFPKDYFSWVVPEKNFFRIGLGSMKGSGVFLDSFMKKFYSNYKDNVVSFQGGVIPLYKPFNKTHTRRVFLVGDAGNFNKASTGGGIVTSLYSSKIFSNKLLGYEYKKDLFNLHLELTLHYYFRKFLNKYNVSDYNVLLEKLKDDKVKRIVMNESRDFPLKLFLKLAYSKPSLLLEGFKLFRF